MNRVIIPLAIPLAALASIAVIVFLVSRVLLAFSKETTPIVALGLALVVLLGASFIASRVGSA